MRKISNYLHFRLKIMNFKSGVRIEVSTALACVPTGKLRLVACEGTGKSKENLCKIKIMNYDF
jgi:hypothetical protein